MEGDEKSVRGSAGLPICPWPRGWSDLKSKTMFGLPTHPSMRRRRKYSSFIGATLVWRRYHGHGTFTANSRHIHDTRTIGRKTFWLSTNPP